MASNKKSYTPVNMAPYVRDSDTSKAAADSLSSAQLNRLEAKVVALLSANGKLGATDDEIEVVTGMSHQTASARRNTLVARGFVVDTGLRRKTRSGRKAAVWALVGLA